MSDDWFRQYRDSQSLLADARQDLRLVQSALHVEHVARERAEAEVRRLRALLQDHGIAER